MSSARRSAGLRFDEHRNEVVSVFGLPTTTVVIIVGIPVLWVAYTAVFVFLSRRWSAEDAAGDEDRFDPDGLGSTSSADGGRV